MSFKSNLPSALIILAIIIFVFVIFPNFFLNQSLINIPSISLNSAQNNQQSTIQSATNPNIDPTSHCPLDFRNDLIKGIETSANYEAGQGYFHNGVLTGTTFDQVPSPSYGFWRQWLVYDRVGNEIGYKCHKGISVGENINYNYCQVGDCVGVLYCATAENHVQYLNVNTTTLLDNQGNIVSKNTLTITATFSRITFNQNLTVVDIDLSCQ